MGVRNVSGGSGGIPAGLGANRPAPSVGGAYFATDNGELTVCNAAGNAWLPLATTSAATFTVQNSLGISGAALGFSRNGSSGNIKVSTQLESKLGSNGYSASITPDTQNGPWQSTTVTNATAFTINAPVDTPGASNTGVLTIEILNSSGGAMGAITWNGVFKFNGFTWTNPANGLHRFARFEWNGASWICTAMSGADY